MEPKHVHFLSDVAYATDVAFRGHKTANPKQSVAQVAVAAADDIAKRLRLRKGSADTSTVTLFHAKSGLFNIDLLSGFGFVAHGTGSRANELVLVTRGTNFQYNKFDLATNANIGYGIGPRGNVVHRGFLKTFKSYQSQLVSFVSQGSAKRPSTIHCMGHSLGGALSGDYRRVLNRALTSTNTGCFMAYRVRVALGTIMNWAKATIVTSMTRSGPMSSVIWKP